MGHIVRFFYFFFNKNPVSTLEDSIFLPSSWLDEINIQTSILSKMNEVYSGERMNVRF